MQSIVQQLATSYQRHGRGRQLLVLHGWGDDSRSWQVFAKQLSRSYEVVLVDLPGFGGSEAPKSAWGLTEYATFVADFAAKAGLKPYAILGHSNGGAIALRAAAQRLLLPDKLILLASAGIRESSNRKTALRLLAKAGKLAAAPLPSRMRQKLRRSLYRAAGSDMLLAEHMQETFKRVVGEDVRADASSVTIPTLLVYGEDDTATPVRYGQLLADCIKGSRLERVPGAGHFLQVDKPELVGQLIREFLQ